MASTVTQAAPPIALPRVAITYCTQCRWMLRAAYFAQELLSTFANHIGEMALIPATGGVFTVELVLKQLVRDRIDPNRDLGHSDTHGKKKVVGSGPEAQDQAQAQKGVQEIDDVKRNPDGTVCEECS
ncbi:hypothetical protein ACEQ8H_004451 [Pleosporales sp. CAS-2024a]